MRQEDLTQKHIDALKVIFDGQQVAHTSLARKLQWDKAMALSIIDQLCSARFVSDYSNGLYGVSPSGRDVLIASGYKPAERKPRGQTAHKLKTVIAETAKKEKQIAEYLNPEHADLAGKDENTSPHLPDHEQTAETLKSIDVFLQKLTSPTPIIANAQFKFAALNNLASGLLSEEPAIAKLLRDVAQDIHRIACLGGAK